MRKRKYTKEFLEPFVKEATNFTDLLRNLGLKITGGNHRLITARVKEYEIDHSHFTGMGWAKGRTMEDHESLKSASRKLRMPDSEVFKKNSGFNSSRLGKRLEGLGWEKKCSNPKCGLTSWLGEPITLHVDHKNGDHSDHRLENLRFLCPNCHQQTKTWGSKSK